jgi:hypothetical protein
MREKKEDIGDKKKLGQPHFQKKINQNISY